MHVYIVYSAPGCHDKTTRQLEQEARFNRDPCVSECVWACVCVYYVSIFMLACEL